VGDEFAFFSSIDSIWAPSDQENAMQKYAQDVSPMQLLTYAHVSRNLSREDEEKIRSSRYLPPEWQNKAHLRLAHCLYWNERGVTAICLP
jgi:hypothetical protein